MGALTDRLTAGLVCLTLLAGSLPGGAFAAPVPVPLVASASTVDVAATAFTGLSAVVPAASLPATSAMGDLSVLSIMDAAAAAVAAPEPDPMPASFSMDDYSAMAFVPAAAPSPDPAPASFSMDDYSAMAFSGAAAAPDPAFSPEAFGAMAFAGAAAAPEPVGDIAQNAMALAGPGALVTNATCPDVNFFKQITRICWRCFFPFVLFSIPIGGSTLRLPTVRAAPICICPGRILPIPSPGFTLGWWSPDHIIENVRAPWCMPSLGGIALSVDMLKGSDIGISGAGATNILPSRMGKQDAWKGNKGGAKKEGAFYNFHWIKFPLAYFLGWLSDFACSKKQATAIDIAFMSEFDPSWNNDELALWTSPETTLFTGVWAPISCAVDGIAATTTKPVNSIFWCAGTWGQLYPYSGNTPTAQSDPRDASLNAIKGVAKMHRFTLARKSYGNSAVCMDLPYFILDKQQYRLQTMHPIPELDNHWIGSSTFRWGEWRNIPAVGEDFVWMQWTYHECCVTLW